VLAAGHRTGDLRPGSGLRAARWACQRIWVSFGAWRPLNRRPAKNSDPPFPRARQSPRASPDVGCHRFSPAPADQHCIKRAFEHIFRSRRNSCGRGGRWTSYSPFSERAPMKAEDWPMAQEGGREFLALRTGGQRLRQDSKKLFAHLRQKRQRARSATTAQPRGKPRSTTAGLRHSLGSGQFTPVADLPRTTDCAVLRSLHGGVVGEGYDVAALVRICLTAWRFADRQSEWIQEDSAGQRPRRGYFRPEAGSSIRSCAAGLTTSITSVPNFSRTPIINFPAGAHGGDHLPNTVHLPQTSPPRMKAS